MRCIPTPPNPPTSALHPCPQPARPPARSFDALSLPPALLPAYLCAMFLELGLAFFRWVLPLPLLLLLLPLLQPLPLLLLLLLQPLLLKRLQASHPASQPASQHVDQCGSTSAALLSKLQVHDSTVCRRRGPEAGVQLCLQPAAASSINQIMLPSCYPLFQRRRAGAHFGPRRRRAWRGR